MDAVLVADALLQARRDGQPVDAAAFGASLLNAAEAYGVQALVARRDDTADAGVARYWKSGGPSREGALTHAPLPMKGVWSSPADARDWPCNLRIIEAEIALRLGRNVSRDDALALTHEDAASFVDAMAVSIELVDSRWLQGVQAPPLLKLADLQSHGALVLGEWQPFAARDWLAQRCELKIGESPAVEFRGTHSLGDPAWVLQDWLRHATSDGGTVVKGTVVTTGTWCGMLPASEGDFVVARFDGVGEASLQL
ncbi:MAG: fumarylacetoacetate hydrolase family protein [Ramlibacter sp.]